MKVGFTAMILKTNRRGQSRKHSHLWWQSCSVGDVFSYSCGSAPTYNSYWAVLRGSFETLAERIRKSFKVHRSRWRLHHDNARSYVASVVAQKCATTSILCGPCSVWLFLCSLACNRSCGASLWLFNGRSHVDGDGSEHCQKPTRQTRWVYTALWGYAERNHIMLDSA